MNNIPTPTITQLEQIIPAEIKNDALYLLIRDLAATESLRHVLEIGSSAGGGSTEAFVAGLSVNPGSPKLFCIEVSRPRFEVLRSTYADRPFVHCYNMSSVRTDEFPDAAAVEAFYNSTPTALNRYPLQQVLEWRERDIAYVRDANVPAGAIEHIKAEHGIDAFDLVLIDGSEFTGEVELEKVIGARIILLDDSNCYKCHAARRKLLAHPDYECFADDPCLRNGYSAFRRRDVANALPIHFFTIVLNGEPFIRYHEQMLRQLPFRWHWHVVEGVAALKHDTDWSVATGGKVTDGIHRQGRSNDGTSAYLDDLAARFPDQVTLYRKPLGEFWDGKREMVNAPLPNITEPCLLWQIDSDELWTADQVVSMRRRFMAEPGRSAAYYWCWYFVTPDKVISTRYNYAQDPVKEWLRSWRFQPGDYWAAHEPPTLVRPSGPGMPPADIASQHPFLHDETEAAGAVFQHFAYTTEAQLNFKETYYGLPGALKQWRNLQAHRGSGFLADYFAWVTDRTIFDDAAFYGVQPMAQWNPANASWAFNLPSGKPPAPAVRPRIVVDGVYWQYLNSGIGRVWRDMLREWVRTGQVDHIVVLDRVGRAPREPGVHYFTAAMHDSGSSGADSAYLEQVCRRLNADLFVSTYYTTPLETPSFFFGYDMIPEMTGVGPGNDTTEEKARAIRHASGHLMISHSSARDLARLFPEVHEAEVTVAYCGLAEGFSPATAAEVAEARRRLKLPDRYVLMVGDRNGTGGYKNGILAFQAAETAARRGLNAALICVGGLPDIDPAHHTAAPSVEIRRLEADDSTLRLLYAGAHALLYPSRYEGFGLPVLEAMACGCPVITCANSSLPEVGGEAALYVSPDDAEAMAAALVQLAEPDFRSERVRLGLAQAARFSTAEQAAQAMQAMLATAASLARGERAGPGSGWREMRRYQAGIQAWVEANPEMAEQLSRRASGDTPTPRLSGALLRATQELEAIKGSSFWRLRSLMLRSLDASGMRRPVQRLLRLLLRRR
jgi:glycosyltransferase involved in cell wall biosynthesis